CRTACARAGFNAAALLQAKLLFRPEELVAGFLGRLLRAAELLAHALFLGDAALVLDTGKQLALAALDRRGGFGTAVVLARSLCKGGERSYEQQHDEETSRHQDATPRIDGGSARAGEPIAETGAWNRICGGGSAADG